MLKSRKLRLVIRASLKNMLVQIIEYAPKGDKVVVSASSRDVEKLGWKYNTGNTPASYLTGLLLGKKAKEKGVKEAIVDVGMKGSTKGSKIYACLKGVLDSGLDVPYSEEVLPSEERISGKDIEAYAGKLSENKEAYEKQFAKCLKEGLDPKHISTSFDDIKKKIKVE